MPLGPAGRRGRRRGVVIGAAIANRRNNNDNDQPAEAPQAAASGDDQLAQLEKLGQLHTSGVLTDEEFAAKKKEILGL